MKQKSRQAPISEGILLAKGKKRCVALKVKLAWQVWGTGTCGCHKCGWASPSLVVSKVEDSKCKWFRALQPTLTVFHTDDEKNKLRALVHVHPVTLRRKTQSPKSQYQKEGSISGQTSPTANPSNFYLNHSVSAHLIECQLPLTVTEELGLGKR